MLNPGYLETVSGDSSAQQNLRTTELGMNEKKKAWLKVTLDWQLCGKEIVSCKSKLSCIRNLLKHSARTVHFFPKGGKDWLPYDVQDSKNQETGFLAYLGSHCFTQLALVYWELVDFAIF